MEEKKNEEVVDEIKEVNPTTTATTTSTTTSGNATSNDENKSSAASGGWGGSWWSAATSLVSSSVDTYIKPTVSTITETTSHLVRELVMEDENKTEKIPENAESNSETPTTNQQQADFFTVMDKSLTMIGDSVDKLGNYLNQGITKVVENTSDLQTMASASLEKAKSVAAATTEKGLHVGEHFATSSVNALESVGKTALEFLTVQEATEERGPRLRPVFMESAQNAVMSKDDIKAPSFEEVLKKNYFEECHGTAHLQALEKLSIECTLKIQKLEQQADPKQLEEINEIVNALKEIFDDEEQSEKKEVEYDKSITQKTEAIFQEAQEKAKEIVLLYKKDIEDLKPSGTPVNELVISPTDICHLTASYLDKILLECVKSLSKFSATSIEEILHLVESTLKQTYTREEAKQKAIVIYKISQVLAEELSKLSNSYVECIRSLTEESKATFQELGKRTDQEKEESQKCIEDIAAKMDLHVNHIYLDTNNAVSNIVDSKQYLFLICKSMLYA